MLRVILESPYAGDVELNTRYARACLRDSLKRGESPIASHLLYTQPGVLDDLNPDERKQGIEAGHAWVHQADAMVVYQDLQISSGMKYGIAAAMAADITIIYRNLNPSDMATVLASAVNAENAENKSRDLNPKVQDENLICILMGLPHTTPRVYLTRSDLNELITRLLVKSTKPLIKRNSSKNDTAVLYLTGRNVQTLLSKLDRVKRGDSSLCSLIKYDTSHPEYPISSTTIVTATEEEIPPTTNFYISILTDDEYYKNRQPGKADSQDEPPKVSY